MVLVLLVIGWAVVLFPAALRRHAERRSGDSIVDFRDRLARLHRHGSSSGALGRHGAPRPVPVRPLAAYPPAARHADLAVARARSRRAKKRRRDILAGLLASMVGSAVLALLPGLGALWMLHVVLDVLFVLYVVLLRRARQAALAAGGHLQPLWRSAADLDVDGAAFDDDLDYELAWSHAANE